MKKFILLVFLLLSLVMVAGCWDAPNPFAGNYQGLIQVQALVKTEEKANISLTISTNGSINGNISKVLSNESITVSGNVSSYTNDVGAFSLNYQFPGDDSVLVTGQFVKQEAVLVVNYVYSYKGNYYENLQTVFMKI